MILNQREMTESEDQLPREITEKLASKLRKL